MSLPTRRLDASLRTRPTRLAAGPQSLQDNLEETNIYYRQRKLDREVAEASKVHPFLGMLLRIWHWIAGKHKVVPLVVEDDDDYPPPGFLTPPTEEDERLHLEWEKEQQKIPRRVIPVHRDMIFVPSEKEERLEQAKEVIKQKLIELEQLQVAHVYRAANGNVKGKVNGHDNITASTASITPAKKSKKGSQRNRSAVVKADTKRSKKTSAHAPSFALEPLAIHQNETAHGSSSTIPKEQQQQQVFFNETFLAAPEPVLNATAVNPNTSIPAVKSTSKSSPWDKALSKNFTKYLKTK